MKLFPHISVTTSLIIVLVIVLFLSGGYFIFHNENQSKIKDELIDSAKRISASNTNRSEEAILNDLDVAKQNLKKETEKLNFIMEKVTYDSPNIPTQDVNQPLTNNQGQNQAPSNTTNTQKISTSNSSSKQELQNQIEIVNRIQTEVDVLETELINKKIEQQNENPFLPGSLSGDTPFGSYELIIPDFYNPFSGDPSYVGKPKLIQGANMVY